MLGWGSGLLARLRGDAREEQRALYEAVVARGRAPHWYLDGAVADTADGRFDMIAAVLAAVLVRLEDEPAGAEPAARLTERFIDDMDGQLREGGVGDIVVGRKIGRLLAMLGGRLGAYRDGWVAGDIGAALTRNLYRGQTPAPDALAHVREALDAFHAALRTTPLATIAAGELP